MNEEKANVFTHRDEDGNETEYKIDEMTNENRGRINHILSLRQKIQVETFNYAESISCLKAGLQVYERELVESLSANGQTESKDSPKKEQAKAEA